MLGLLLTVIAANGLISCQGAIAPPPGDDPPAVERSFERWDKNSDGVIDRNEFREGLRRLVERFRGDRRGRDFGPRDQAGPPREGRRMERPGPPRDERTCTPNQPEGRPECRVEDAVKRAIVQTLRRHRPELEAMVREAADQAVRELHGSPKAWRGERPGGFGGPPGKWERRAEPPCACPECRKNRQGPRDGRGWTRDMMREDMKREMSKRLDSMDRGRDGRAKHQEQAEPRPLKAGKHKPAPPEDPPDEPDEPDEE